MKIVICEDNSTQAAFIRKLVIEWAALRKLYVDIGLFNSAESFLFSIEDDISPDILLLDIQMSKMNGMQLARKMREYDNDVIIVFITAIKEYVFEGYDVNALDYILKPVKKENLFKCLDKAGVKKKSNKFLLVNNTKIKQSDIVYIEALAHYIHIHKADDEIRYKQAIGSILESLDSSNFIQCHRSYIINLKYVLKITKTDVVLDNGRKIPLSRTRYSEVNKAFISYYTGGTK